MKSRLNTKYNSFWGSQVGGTCSLESCESQVIKSRGIIAYSLYRTGCATFLTVAIRRPNGTANVSASALHRFALLYSLRTLTFRIRIGLPDTRRKSPDLIVWKSCLVDETRLKYLLWSLGSVSGYHGL